MNAVSAAQSVHPFAEFWPGLLLCVVIFAGLIYLALEEGE